MKPKPTLYLLKPEVAEIGMSLANDTGNRVIELGVRLRWYERTRIEISPTAQINLVRQYGASCPARAIEAACYSAASFALRKVGYGRCYVEVTKVVGNVGDFDLMVLAAMMSLSVFLLTGHQEIYEEHATQDLLAGWRVRSCELSDPFPPYLPQFERQDKRLRRVLVDVGALTCLLSENFDVRYAEEVAASMKADDISGKKGFLIQTYLVSSWFGFDDPTTDWLNRPDVQELISRIEERKPEVVLTFPIQGKESHFTILCDAGYKTLYGILLSGIP